MRRDSKYVVFNSKEKAERFKLLYGGVICYDDYFYRRYFGEKVVGKSIVVTRKSTEEMTEICKALELKKTRFNGKIIYVF